MTSGDIVTTICVLGFLAFICVIVWVEKDNR